MSARTEVVRVVAVLWLAIVASAARSAEAEADGVRPPSPRRRDPDVSAAARKDAGEALSRGQFARARSLYEAVSRLDRADPHAAREAGRAALALGDLTYAVTALQRASVLAGHAPDPELHYLCGEALYALARRDDAQREHVLVERELRARSPTRQSQLWLARVYARRGDLARADLIYRSLTPPGDRPADAEVAIHHAESHVLARHGRGAQRILRAFLARTPDHRRARELLAASLEASGDLDDELAVREALARGATTSQSWFDYGRALERSGDFSAALRAYRSARAHAEGRARNAPELVTAVRRMGQRTSVEVAASLHGRSDPSATSLGAQIGIAVPFGSAHHLALGAWRERLAARGRSRDGSAGELWMAMAVHGRRSDVIAGGKLGVRERDADDGSADGSTSWSGFVKLRGRPLRHLEVSLDGEVNALWRETPRSLLEGGRATGATAHVYGIAFANRLIVDSGAQIRRLALAGLGGAAAPTTSQLLGWAGLDVVLWSNFERALVGEALDDQLLQPTYVADSIVAGYRHYELVSDSQPEFLRRMSMVERASIEEGSLTARKVLARDRVALELRGALGWDHARELATSRIGASVVATPTRSSRISLSLDLGAESPNGFRGQVRTGWMSYHEDF